MIGGAYDKKEIEQNIGRWSENFNIPGVISSLTMLVIIWSIAV